MRAILSDVSAEQSASVKSADRGSPNGKQPASPQVDERLPSCADAAIKLSAEMCERLCCPSCQAGLDMVGNGFYCTDESCGKRYPSVKGIPVLIDEARSIFTIESFLRQTRHFFPPTRPIRRLLSACLPSLSHDIAGVKTVARMRELLLARSHDPRVLVVGGGEVGAGLDVLLNDPAIEVVHSDVSVSDHIGCICDGHDLPFRDCSFDGVIVQAVLEHVLDPVRCVNEIHRVLKDDGLVYSDTPFVCQVHGRQFDFTRFTRLGHRHLFRHFREISSGISGGPGTALGWTLHYFCLSFLTRPILRSIAGVFSHLAFFWLKYFDYVLVNKPGALDTAFAFYFLGQKCRLALSDDDLLASYRGGFN